MTLPQGLSSQDIMKCIRPFEWKFPKVIKARNEPRPMTQEITGNVIISSGKILHSSYGTVSENELSFC